MPSVTKMFIMTIFCFCLNSSLIWLKGTQFTKIKKSKLANANWIVYNTSTILLIPKCINSFWPSDAIWRRSSESTLSQIMACYLASPSITWANIDLSLVRFYGIHLRSISQESSQATIPYNEIEIYRHISEGPMSLKMWMGRILKCID